MTWLSAVKGQWSIVLLFFLSFSILTRFNIDPDFGWHMAYGEAYLARGEIIREDPFSFTMPNYVWGNSYFLYQIFVAYIFNNFGFWLLAVLFGFVASISVLILTFKNLDFFKGTVVVLGAILATSNLGVRPHTFSFFFFCLLLVFLEKGLYKHVKYIPLWFTFFLLWANVHRAFVVGLLIFGLYLVLASFQEKMKNSKGELRVRAGCIAAAVMGTIATPFPLDLFKSGVFFDLTTFENLRYIAEWQPLALVSPLSIIFALSGIVFIKIFNKYYRQIGPAWIIIAAFLFSLAFVSATFTFFWAAIFIYLASRHLSVSVKIPVDFWSRVPMLTSILAVSLAFVLTFAASFLESFNFEKRLVLDDYPVAALESLDEKKFRGNIFNAYEWGGFVDWRSNSVKVFIDGRMAGWRKPDGTSILGDYIEIMKGNCEILNNYHIELALIKKNSNTLCFDEWEIEYQDDVAKILRRAG